MIREAAVLKNGKLYAGKTHRDIYEKNKGAILQYDSIQGFITDQGVFVDRIEAAKIAYECKQINKETQCLICEDLE